MFNKFLETHDLSKIDFSHEFLPARTDRAFWETFPKGDWFTEAEQALDYGWPPIKATDWMAFKTTGDRKIMENIHFARRKTLIRLVLAELCENEGRFIPQIVNGLFSICEESYWGLSAHWWGEVGYIPSPQYPYIDLFAAETGALLSVTYHLLYEPLQDFCPDILDRLEYELERRIRVPYLTHRDFWWMGWASFKKGKRVNNWNPWILSNVLTTFLLTEKHPKRLCEGIKKIMTELQHYYDSIPADGGCDEGPSYWGHAGGSLFENLYLLKLASGGAVDLFHDEKLKNMAAYMKKVHLADGRFVNFADAHASSQKGLMWLAYGFGRETEQSEVSNFASAVYQSGGVPPYTPDDNCSLRRAIWRVAMEKAMAKTAVSLPLHGAVEYLPDLEVAVLREGDWLIGAKGGHNAESHNHNDVGSFILYDGGAPVLVDPGIGVYSKFTFGKWRYEYTPWVNSDVHNLPVVNGVRQLQGEEFRSSGFEVEQGSIHTSFAGAYPSEAGVREIDRRIELTEKGMCMADRFAFAADAKRVTEHFVTPLSVEIEGNVAILGGRYRLTVSEGTLHTDFLSFEGDANLTRDWNGAEGLTRIALKTDGASEIKILMEKI